MILDHRRPHAFRESRVEPSQAQAVAADHRETARVRQQRSPECEAWAVHVATDGTRVMTLEAWRDAEAFSRDTDARQPGVALYAWVGTGGLDPTPVGDPTSGIIVIDVFPVWRPIVRPVSRFNLKNGEAFNRHPGCISTTVLRGLTAGSIATYARWRSEADFLAAFGAVSGAPVETLEDINAYAARKTLGVIRPDYHAYDLFCVGGDD